MKYFTYRLVTAMIWLRVSLTTLAYIPPDIRQRWKDDGYTMQNALDTITACAVSGSNTQQPKELFWAIKFIDRNANQLYPTLEDRQELMKRCNGSWELRLACNNDRDEEFYPHPEFRAFAKAFSTVAPTYFGKGIATNDNGFCFVALGGPSTRNVARRQVFMNYEDYFINGQQVPGWDLSYYLRGWQRNAASAERKRPKLAFTVILATEKCMAVRGSKTGGMAIFKKIDEDMSQVAYGARWKKNTPYKEQ